MRNVVALLLFAGFLAAAFSGCISEKGAEAAGAKAPAVRAGATARDPASPEFKPHVVIAVVDTGINPYHSEFAERYEYADPSEYIVGYPDDVIPLKLSEFKARGSAANRDKADEALWKATKPNTLYRVEGTKIVGLINFAGLLPGSGHGTMTASRASGNTISVGGPAARLVMVSPFSIEAIEWAASQDWIDMISVSSGLTTGTLVPLSSHVLDQDVMKRFNAAAHKKPLFASSGNGLGNTGAAGFPAWMRGPSGVPDLISVGANDNGKMSVWHNQHSYIVGDGCQNPSATDNSADRIANTGGGTSSATPFSAGSGAALLLEARRLLGDNHTGARTSPTAIPSFNSWKSGNDGDAKIVLAMGDPTLHQITDGPLADGVFTLQEFKDVIYHTAIPGGSEDPSDGNACTGTGGAFVPTENVPRDLLAQFEGYGEVNGKSAGAAVQVIRGDAKLPQRPGDDAWYERFYAIRSTTTPP